MFVTYYVECLRDWAASVCHERYPYHVTVSVDGRVRLEAYLDAPQEYAGVLGNLLAMTWNASSDLSRVGVATWTDSMTITFVDSMSHSISVASIPPHPWRPRHLLARLVSRVLPTRTGTREWSVREVQP